MDRQKGAWFFGWLVTRKGSDTSGNWGHKGVKNAPWGKGGSAAGGGHMAIGVIPGTPKEDVKEHVRLVREEREAKKEKPKAGAVGTPGDFQAGIDEKALWKAYAAGDERITILDSGANGPGVSGEWLKAKITDLSDSTGIDPLAIRSALATWEETSNDNNLKALSMQEAVSEEFGVPLSDFQQKKLSEQRELRDFYLEQYGPEAKKRGEDPEVYLPSNMKPSMTSSEQRAFVRDMYDMTQEALEKAGYKPGDTIRLFRGVGTTEDVRAGDVVNVDQNAMSSWSVLRDQAAMRFARDATYRKENGAVLVMDVPIENILSNSRTGFGMFTEGEFVVLGTPGSQASVGLVYYR